MKVQRALRRCYNLVLIFSFIFGCIWVFQPSSAQAQTRVNDKDMTAIMKNLHQDVHSFRPLFDKAVHKSTIRHTSQERDARDMSLSLDRETDALIQNFKKNRNGGEQFRRVMEAAEPIDTVVHTLQLGPEVAARWQIIRAELHQLGLAYAYPESFRYPIDSANQK